MKKIRKLWIGVGAFMLAGGSAATVQGEVSEKRAVEREVTQPSATGHSQHWRLAQAATFGQGGEAGEAGEGGEAGIDVDAASRDPVEYRIALQVIAAHYHAGLAAYEAGEQEAGAQMLAHGLSEIYVEMEPVFEKLGVTDLGKKLQAAVDAATEKKPVAEVRRRVRDVFTALAAADKKAPKSDVSALAVSAKVTVSMIDRAAAQYPLFLKDKGLETYLDGLGFVMAGRNLAKTVVPALAKQDPAKARTIGTALALLSKAYPGIKRPQKPAVAEGNVLAAASRAKLAVSGLR